MKGKDKPTVKKITLVSHPMEEKFHQICVTFVKNHWEVEDLSKSTTAIGTKVVLNAAVVKDVRIFSFISFVTNSIAFRSEKNCLWIGEQPFCDGCGRKAFVQHYANLKKQNVST